MFCCWGRKNALLQAKEKEKLHSTTIVVTATSLHSSINQTLFSYIYQCLVFLADAYSLCGFLCCWKVRRKGKTTFAQWTDFLSSLSWHNVCAHHHARMQADSAFFFLSSVSSGKVAEDTGIERCVAPFFECKFDFRHTGTPFRSRLQNYCFLNC